jgi:hypothetical protein
VAALRAGKPEPRTFAGFLGQAHGVAIDWPAVCPGAEEGQHTSQRIEAATTADGVFPLIDAELGPSENCYRNPGDPRS